MRSEISRALGHRKMESLKGPLTFFFPGDCYEEVVVKHNVFNGNFTLSLLFPLQCGKIVSVFLLRAMSEIVQQSGAESGHHYRLSTR